MRSRQLSFFPPAARAYGGALMSTRKGRPKGGRPLSTKETMHLVIRSTKARGAWSFRKPQNATLITKALKRFSQKHFVKVFKIANVGNHLHLHIRVHKRFGYTAFIRAFTSTIAVGITRANDRQMGSALATKPPDKPVARTRLKFFDLRPFTRIIQSHRAFLTVRDYLRINELEGAGVYRGNARLVVAWESRWRGA